MNNIENLLAIETISELEPLGAAVEAQTNQYLTKEVTMYTPIYVTNYCNNLCTYCAFKSTNKSITRSRLSIAEFETECKHVKALGFQHIIIVGGEDYKLLTIDFLNKLIKVAKKYFTFVALEVQPLKLEEYQKLKNVGLDGVTIYQETYDVEAYEKYHLRGPKSIFSERLVRLENAVKAGIKAINIGVLLGLGSYNKDLKALNDHLSDLQEKYPEAEYSVSILRIKPIKGNQSEFQSISDFQLVKAILIIRNLNQRVGLTMSTRESVNLKKHLIKYGVKKISASVSTAVGGHTTKNDNGQFKISDESSIEEQMKTIRELGYIPVLQDWQ